MSETDSLQRAHEAIKGLVGEGEIVVAWTLQMDVASADDDERYLAHRSGGGMFGEEQPMPWTAVGMIKSALVVAELQLLDMTVDASEEDDEE